MVRSRKRALKRKIAPKTTAVRSYVCTNRAFLCVFQPFLRFNLWNRSLNYCALFSLYRSWANNSDFGFYQFTRRSLLFFLLSTIAPKIMVRSRAKSDWAVSKSDLPSSAKMGYDCECAHTLGGELEQARARHTAWQGENRFHSQEILMESRLRFFLFQYFQWLNSLGVLE